MDIASTFNYYFQTKSNSIKDTEINKIFIKGYLQAFISFSGKVLYDLDKRLVRQIIDPFDSLDPRNIFRQFTNAGLPFYYSYICTEISKRNYNSNSLLVYTGKRFSIEFQLSKQRKDGLIVLMESKKDGRVKYLCGFKDLMDDNTENNKFFVWNDDLDYKFDKLTLQNVKEAKKISTFENCLKEMIN